jgi:hypothetical protein
MHRTLAVSAESPDDDVSDADAEVRSKCWHVLTRALHAAGDGVGLNEMIARRRIRAHLNVPALDHKQLALVLKTYACFSPWLILKDVVPFAVDQLDLLLTLVPGRAFRTPKEGFDFADAIGALKVCAHVTDVNYSFTLVPCLRASTFEQRGLSRPPGSKNSIVLDGSQLTEHGPLQNNLTVCSLLCSEITNNSEEVKSYGLLAAR